MSAIDATGAERVLVTHGYRDPVVRALRERGIDADSIASRWEGEGDSEAGQDDPRPVETTAADTRDQADVGDQAVHRTEHGGPQPAATHVAVVVCRFLRAGGRVHGGPGRAHAHLLTLSS